MKASLSHMHAYYCYGGLPVTKIVCEDCKSIKADDQIIKLHQISKQRQHCAATGDTCTRGHVASTGAVTQGHNIATLPLPGFYHGLASSLSTHSIKLFSRIVKTNAQKGSHFCGGNPNFHAQKV